MECKGQKDGRAVKEWKVRERGDGQRGEAMPDSVCYFSAANKSTGEWEHVERCKEAAITLARVPVPCEERRALCGVQGTRPCLPALHQMKQIRSLPHRTGCGAFLLRHTVWKHGKERGYGSLLTKSEDSWRFLLMLQAKAATYSRVQR